MMELKRLKSSLQFAKLQYKGCPDDTNKLILETAQSAYDAALGDNSQDKTKEPAKKVASKPKGIAATKVTTTPAEETKETPEDGEIENNEDENSEKKTE